MTIGVNNRNDAIGNDAADTYPYQFKIFAATDLEVKVRDAAGLETTLTYLTHYTVTNVGVKAGGNVVLVNGAFAWLDADGDLATGYHITARRVRPLTQTSDIRNQGGFFADVHEDTFDHLMMVDQQQQDEIDRSLKITTTEDGSIGATIIPDSAARAGRVLGFDLDGDVEMLSVLTTVYGVRESKQTATLGQTLVNLSFSYVTGVNALAVYVNGFRMERGADFNETSSSSFTMTYGLAAGDHVVAYGGQEITGTGAIDASIVSFTPTGGAASNVGAELQDTIDKLPAHVNLFPNSELSICTAIPLVRVGSAVPIQSFAASGVDTGVVVITAAASVSGHAGGIVPGKLFLVDGSATPHAAHVALSGTVSVSGGAKRLTCAAASFGGVEVGDIMHVTGGSNTSPKARYRVTATDANTYVEAYGFTATTLVTEGPVTFDITWYEGSKDVDATMNGMPATGDAVNTSLIGYPLMATECSAGSFKATLAGKNLNAAGSAAETAWEVTPGDAFGVSGDAADGWGKTTTLKYWRTYKKDWDGTTVVVKDGSDYGCKLQKGSAGTEYWFSPLTAVSPVNHSDGTYIPEKLAQFKGKRYAAGFFWMPPGANKARPFIFDGVTFTFGPYYAAGSLTWQEVTATIGATADRVISGIELTGAVDDIHYGTQPMFVGGREIGEGNYVSTTGVHVFASHPNFWSYVNATVPRNALIRIEQESCGALPRGLKGVFAQIEMQNSNPPSQNPITGMALWDSPSVRVPCITVYDFWAPQMIAFSTGTVTPGAGATTYFGLGNASAVSEALSQQYRVPFPFAILDFYTQAGAGPVGAETFTYTVRKQNADTTLTCSTTGASTQASDTNRAHKATGNAGDVLDIKLVTSAGAAVTPHNATLVLYNTSHTLSCNAGFAVIGKYSESTPTWLSDCMYVEVGESPNAGVKGVNIDMFSAML